MTDLRPYQQSAVTQTLADLDRGLRSVVVVAATGSGKTVIGADLVQRLAGAGRKILWVAHRIELVDQALARMGIACGKIVAGEPSTDGACIVASKDTLLAREMPPGITDIVVDEVHHVMSAGYLKLLDRAPQADLIGLTATPCRLDGKGLGEVFNSMVIAAKTSELIAAGHLVKPRVFTVPVLPDLSGVSKSRGDYKQDELEVACNVPRLRGDIVEHWRGQCAGMPTVLFAVSIAHSKALCQDFANAGITAVHVDGTMSATARDAALDAVRSGAASVLSNVGIVTEGWDFPALACCILARPTASLSLLLQMWGRIMRPFGAKRATVLDHAGNVVRHGVLPDTDIEWSLDAAKVKPPKQSVTNCPACYTLQLSTNVTCEACGAKLHADKKAKKPPAEVLADTTTQLAEVDTIVAKAVLGWLESVKDKPEAVGNYTLRLCERFRLGAKAKRPLPPDFHLFVLRQRGNLGKAAWAYNHAKKKWP